ncbi:MAG: hypothetical protein AAF619_02795 [Pseudomonadota bacterium]
MTYAAQGPFAWAVAVAIDILPLILLLLILLSAPRGDEDGPDAPPLVPDYDERLDRLEALALEHEDLGNAVPSAPNL